MEDRRVVVVPGAVIVGAGPSGLAVAACLGARGVPNVVLERASCIASLWQQKAYSRLHLHLPKHLCQLPLMPFPPHFPTYPSRSQFVDYLLAYARHFNIRPVFSQAVESARFDGMWRLTTPDLHYVCRWLVVATGENAEVVLPTIHGMDEFQGEMLHSSQYTTGEEYGGKRVLVVGCGNSGMELCLDLCHYGALPSLVVRHRVHVLPKEMLGRSTFDVSMRLMRWLPVNIVDRVLLILTWVLLGDTTKLGLVRPNLGPLQLKHLSGKTPVLDVGTLAKIRTGHIQVMPAIRRINRQSVEFVDGRTEEFDIILFATGYKSNVPGWLKENEMFWEEEGLPKKPFPNGWKGKNGLYAVGFTSCGLVGASIDANKIAYDIERSWTHESKHLSTFASST